MVHFQCRKYWSVPTQQRVLWHLLYHWKPKSLDSRNFYTRIATHNLFLAIDVGFWYESQIAFKTVLTRHYQYIKNNCMLLFFFPFFFNTEWRKQYVVCLWPWATANNWANIVIIIILILWHTWTYRIKYMSWKKRLAAVICISSIMTLSPCGKNNSKNRNILM